MKFGKKVSKSIKKEFDIEPAYNEKYLKIKIKADNAKITIIKYQKKILNVLAYQ